MVICTYVIITPHRPPTSTLFPYTTLFRSRHRAGRAGGGSWRGRARVHHGAARRLPHQGRGARKSAVGRAAAAHRHRPSDAARSEEHTSELQSQFHLVCRLLLEKKK